MTEPKAYLAEVPMAWCPGCGNFFIRESLAAALARLGIPNHKVVLVTGIGQAAKIVHYMGVNGFDGLHGRTLAAAAGIKIANKDLVVIAESGDGDIYGEGGNHLLHNIRRNLDITLIVHDNRVYGLTKGQASPTSDLGFKTKVQTFGVIVEPLRPLALALALGCGFVAQAFSGYKEHAAEVIAKAIEHKGFALVNMLHPCPSWNHVNTFAWFKRNSFLLEDEGWTPNNRLAALGLALTEKRLPLGVLYREEKTTFEDRHPVLQGEPLVLRPLPHPHGFYSVISEFGQ
ncbi:2-oxoacid ferredoxin oxidoreductase [Candidatus Bipolaricaulota bacterium]|nr:2-oxoacid ferredoxin oxidoreductase [Candidatus Bipolaricaulota bacterium]